MIIRKTVLVLSRYARRTVIVILINTRR